MVVVRDPVCGMVFVKEDAADNSLYNDETYYFCAPSCKKSFDNDPEKYLAIFNVNDRFKNINFSEEKRNEKDNSLRKHD